MLLSPRALRFALSHRRLGIFRVSGDGVTKGIASGSPGEDEVFRWAEGLGLLLGGHFAARSPADLTYRSY